ncbi:hypothetical protein TCAL_13366, partial [Tigriopus californicus]
MGPRTSQLTCVSSYYCGSWTSVIIVGIALFGVTLRSVNPDLVLVRVEEGWLQESMSSYWSSQGHRIHSFLGIPYGEARRFKKASPYPPWSGIRQADRHVECTQLGNYGPYETTGVEDCLVVNVYTTALQDQRPVMVWIHGGSFNSGAATPRVYGPEFLLDKDVVLVTINYRLGPLGFLSNGKDDFPGNLGLWDQRLALQWIQKNIAVFGGDKNKVTLFGQSSGGIMVSYHILSHQSQHLFHAAIIQSGAITLPIAKSDNHPGFYAQALAKHFSCGSNLTVTSSIQCLEREDPHQIVLEAKKLFSSFLSNPYPFKPVLDNTTSLPFFRRDPFEILESGDFRQMPIMIGNNRDEGLIVSSNFIRNPRLWREFHQNNDELLPLIFFGRSKSFIETDDMNSLKILLPSDIIPVDFEALTAFVGDHVILPLESVTIDLFLRHNPNGTFVYHYTHQNSYGISDIIAQSLPTLFLRAFAQLFGSNPFSLELGVSHGDELFLLFKPHVIPLNTRFTRRDIQTSQNLVNVWTGFATHQRLPQRHLRASNDIYLEIGPSLTLRHRQLWNTSWHQ